MRCEHPDCPNEATTVYARPYSDWYNPIYYELEFIQYCKQHGTETLDNASRSVGMERGVPESDQRNIGLYNEAQG